MADTSVQRPLEILLIADNQSEERMLESDLAEVAPQQFLVENAVTVRTALSFLKKKKFDLVILDFSLPGAGPDLFSTIKDEAGDIPVVILTNVDSEQLAINAVHEGAQDYIVHGHVNSKHLAQSLHYAIERQRLRDRLVNESLIDPLTGLYNRRGFTSLGQQQLRMADRTKRGLLMFFVDLDGLKQINDVQGHASGDKALTETAEILRETFRKSDIIARLGGDEFSVLAIETVPKYKDIVVTRLNTNIDQRNTGGILPFKLSLSVGVATYDANQSCSIDELIKIADGLMYEQKKAKKAKA